MLAALVALTATLAPAAQASPAASSAPLSFAALATGGTLPTVESTTTSVIETGWPEAGFGGNTWTKTIARDRGGIVHAVYLDSTQPTDTVYYRYSSDNGASWSLAEEIWATPNLAHQPYVKVDDEGDLHVFVPWENAGAHSIFHLRKARGATAWDAVHEIKPSAGDTSFIANPGVQPDGTLSLVFDGGSAAGLYLTERGDSSWTTPTAVAAAPYDNHYQNTLAVGDDLYTVLRRDIGELYLARRVGGAWSPPQSAGLSGIGANHSEVVESAGTILSFVQRNDLANARLDFSTYSPITNSWAAWSEFESEPGTDVVSPTATVDQAGNVWVFFEKGGEIFYRVREEATGLWTDRQRLTELASDGECANPSVRYQENHLFAPGYVELTYRQNDPGETTYRYMYVRLQTAGSNAVPITRPDAYRTDVGVSFEATVTGVLANDSDPNGDAITSVLASDTVHGTLSLAADGTFTYDPEPDYGGPDSFTYRAFDGAGYSEQTQVSIWVGEDPPVAGADSYSMDRYSTLVVAAPGILANDSDPQGDSLSAVLESGVATGTLALSGDGSFTYTPPDSLTGLVTFTYRAADATYTSEPATVTIDVVDAAAVRGTVFDDESLAPIEGVVVRAVLYSDPDPEGTTAFITDVTRADGSFLLAGLDDDLYHLSFCDPSDVYRDAHWGGQGLPIDLTAPFPVSGLVDDFEMPMRRISTMLASRVTRKSGTSRYDTALEISRMFDSADTVIIASGAKYPDALAAAPLAGSYDAPILLTPKDSLPDGFLDEIDRLGATEAVIVGGEGAVAATVASQLSSHGLTVDRIWGTSRYNTAAEITRHLIAREGASLASEPFVVRGDGFADALAVGPFAFREIRPILLVMPDSAPPATVEAFAELGSDTVLVAGGTKAVGDGALYDLWDGALRSRGLDLWLVRMAGTSRYDTAAEVVEAWGEPFDIYAIASGKRFPDALAGGPLLGRHWGAVLLSPPTGLAPEAAALLSRDAQYIWEVLVLGGSGALGSSVVTGATSALGSTVYDMDFLSGVSEAISGASLAAARLETQGPVAPRAHPLHMREMAEIAKPGV